MTLLLRVLACALLLVPSQLPAADTQSFISEKPYPVANIREPEQHLPVNNVILMIGDGMGIHHLSAAWAANRGRLFIENCPVTGIAKTWCRDKLVTDSAAAGTAMATGTKTLYKRVATCPEGNKLDSLIDKAKDMEKSTGVVVTCELNDATPAAFCANNEKRSDSYGIIGDYPRSRADFIFGGGSKYFTQRPDGRDIFKEMGALGYKIARSWEEAAALPPGKTLAVVAPGNLPPPGKRGAVLRQATLKALETLSRNPRGFFLMVEGSNIDKAAHHGKLAEMMEEIFDFDRTAGAVLEWAARHPGTLVVITADHNTGAFSLSGGNLEKGEITALFSSGNHDGVAVPVYAFGSGSGAFTGIYENTDIFRKIMAAMKGEENKAVPVKKDS
ncbi:alkaline phosphatase [Akkermansia sp.]